MSKISAPMIRQTNLLIGGDFIPSSTGKRFNTINPSTEELITTVAEGDADDIEVAVRAARKAFDDGPWHRMSARERGVLLWRLADLIDSNLAELAALETLDSGKPIADSRGWEISATASVFRYFSGWTDKIGGETHSIPGPYFTHTRQEPVGVCGQIIPWNFPLFMAAWKLAPALAAGCTLILKPAEQTPLSALRLGELILEAGFPPGVVNIVTGFGPTAGAALVKNPLVDKIAFTGDSRTAEIIMRDAAVTLKRLSFELGGKSPNIVCDDCDLDLAVEGAFNALFLNAGQNCCAGSRVFVQDSVYDEFVSSIVDLASRRRVGDPFDELTEQGPQVDKDQFNKVLGYIESGRNEGARCAFGGSQLFDKGFYIQPTVYADVKDDMKIAREEIFGPVLCIMKFQNDGEVIERANNSPFGLAAAIWTRDVDRAERAVSQLRAGTVWVNCYNIVDPGAPFGGFKKSGIGRELGKRGLEAYLEPKTVTYYRRWML